MKMNNIKRVVIALLFGSGVAMAGSVVNSKHNLSVGVAEANGQVCVFCHTPHAANPAMTKAPLWNKEVPDATTFTMYGTTVAGTATAATPSMVSLACLSCHDGASAMNSVVNAPGTGLGSGTLGNANNMPGVTEGVPGLGTDLTNDHPISIDYIEGKAGLVPTSTPLTGWGDYTTVNDLLRDGKVECGSCHNVHDPDNGTFLRHSNAGSAVCLACHNK